MKIDFSQVGRNEGAPLGAYRSHESAASAPGLKTEYDRSIRLDISEKDVKSTAGPGYDRSGAEKGTSKAASELLTGLQGLDMSVQHNYFAVMSNSMSGKDFAALSEEGFEVGACEADELVTSLDRIKTVLAQSGNVIAGYNDDIDGDELEAIGGSAVRGAAIEQSIKEALKRSDLPVSADNVNGLERVVYMADSIAQRSGNGLSDDSISFLLEGELLPTLENTYQSLAAGGRRVTPVTEGELTGLSGQIEKVIEDAGYEVSGETKAGAKVLLDRNIPLTADTLDGYMTLKSVELPFDKEALLDRACSQIADGQKPGSLLIVRNERIALQARLVMTGRANLALLKSDHFIDTKDMEAKLSQLEETEAKLSGTAASENQRRLDECMEMTDAVRRMPIAAVAELAHPGIYTLKSISERGSARADAFARAGETYEAVGTQVRGDLGDSIKKAFANADQILKEMKLPVSEANMRAVRILGYNRMEITEENLSSVKEADESLRDLLDALKPGAVMKLIKDGKNPLDMEMRQLTETLNEYAESDDIKDERYARYLLKLEKNGEITEQEREGYIGVYRLFRQVEKSDGAVIGSLLDRGVPLTVKNLLGAVRSRRAAGMDYVVDDDFGGVEKVIPEGLRRIDAQIETGTHSGDHYRQKNNELLETLDPGKIRVATAAGDLDMETDMDRLSEMMRDEKYSDSAGRSASKAAYDQEAERIRRAMSSPQEAVKVLQDTPALLTPNALEAEKALSSKRGDVFKQLSQLGRNLHIAQMIEDFETPEGAEAAIEDLVRENEAAIEEAMEAPDMTSEKLRGLMLMREQLKVIGARSALEDYEVPMEINGELTAVNLRVMRGTGVSSVNAFIRVEEMGEMSISLSATEDGMDGLLTAESREGEAFLSERLGALREAFEAAGEKLSENVALIRGTVNPDRTAAGQRTETGQEISSSRLYGMAKIFLSVMAGV